MRNFEQDLIESLRRHVAIKKGEMEPARAYTLPRTSSVREHAILMTGESVRQILSGSKTQTRRVVLPLPPAETIDFAHLGGAEWACIGNNGPNRRCPYGQPGDRLWVRETFALVKRDGIFCDSLIRGGAGRGIAGQRDSGRAIEYGADEHVKPEPNWLPSIHMPRWASRITLEITAVRPERVQEISEDDAHDEGLEPIVNDPATDGYGEWSKPLVVDARSQFRDLWDSLNAKRGHSWESNPWVWVLTFRRILP